jgi:hypothetical protein
MNINASINSGFNLALRKKASQGRPTFQTVFDKLDARSKKMNYCNPVNSGMTNEQMFRYYLNETEPLLHYNNDTFDFNDMMDGDLKNMKLSDFAKLLTGNLGTDVGTTYQSLPATVSEYGNPTVASILAPPPSTGTFAPPPPVIAPVAPVIAPTAPPAAPSAPPAAPPAAPVIAPTAPPVIAPAAPVIAPPATTPTPPTSPRSLAAAPPPPTPPAGRAAVAAAARAAASAPSAPAAPVAPPAAPTPPASPAAAGATTPATIAAASLLALSSSTPSSISVPTTRVITRSTSSAAASLLALSSAPPAATVSVPASSPARGAAAIAFPETPESKKLKPTQIQVAADYVNFLGLDPTQPLDENMNNTISTFVGFNLNETFHSSPAAAGSSPLSQTGSLLSGNPTVGGTPETGYRNATDIIAVKNGLAAGLNPPRVPKELPEKRFSNPGWAKHFSDMLAYNEELEKDPATNKTNLKFRITERMKLIIETYRSVSGDEKQFKIEIANRKDEYDKLPKEK